MRMEHLFRGAHSHLAAPAALAILSPRHAEARPAGAPHSIAEIVAHMTFWQAWFLDRCDGQDTPMIVSAALGWPSVAEGEWETVRRQFEDGFGRGLALSRDSTRLDTRLSPPIEFQNLTDYTVRDALTHVALHNTHHLGQVITLRQQLGTWPPPAGSWTW
jgi:uncharacterized damage-inducible protein DinB